MTFSELNLSKPLLRALDDLGLHTPTTIQQKVFSVIMSGRDVCGIAQTGTGKTYAYLLPCLRQLTWSKTRAPQLLILVPTRELVAQVVQSIKELTPYLTLQAVGVYGGVNINTQRLEVENGMDIVVATPGRLYDLVLSGSLRLNGIKKVVIDEVDEMLNLGFRTQLINILDLLPVKRQNLLFSATITEEVEALMGTYFNGPERIEAAPAGTPVETIDQKAYEVPNFNTKVNLLEWFFRMDKEMTKVLIFVATKQLADELFERLAENFPGLVGVIHSNKDQNYRFNTINKFKSGEYHWVIATDIVARGLDVAEVSHVINFDLPDAAENYIHRIGRTGRVDRKGIAISFITEKERPYREAIEKLMNLSILNVSLPEGVEISTVLTEDEKPKPFVKAIPLKMPKPEEGGGAFHEKKEKNKKVNVVVSKAERMKQKYGKPKTRRAKRK
ncbi:MAG: DEAD/DEAH box helicase [Bacteroidetes bacterium]|nr:DEAD/DEAH box helicase [Bacteroidota bacterium]